MQPTSTLEKLAHDYRAAYLANDASSLLIGRDIRFSENNVVLPFPDGTWDTVTEEVGPALILSDPDSGQVGIFTAIMQGETPSFLAVRLKISAGEIVEIEHVVSTRRNLSGPPTPIGDVREFVHDLDWNRVIAPEDRIPREAMIELSDGYFATLENNTGEIRGTRFASVTTRHENGMAFPNVEHDFRRGRYRFNERVRDREYFLVDEARGVVMARAFIDHKGRLADYVLNDGTPAKSPFREPQSWYVLEIFKIRHEEISSIEAIFIAVPYWMKSIW